MKRYRYKFHALPDLSGIAIQVVGKRGNPVTGGIIVSTEQIKHISLPRGVRKRLAEEMKIVELTRMLERANKPVGPEMWRALG